MTQTATFDAKALDYSLVTQLTPPTFTSNAWESNWVNARQHRRLTAIIAANQPFATDGVVIEQSLSASPSADADAHYWTKSGSDGTTLSTHPINTSVTYYHVALSVERVGLDARLVVKHAGTAPTVFYARLIGAGVT